MTVLRPIAVFCSMIAIAAPAAAQVAPAAAQVKPSPIIEVAGGASGFVDEVWDFFTTVGAGVRIFLTPRVAVGPEALYMIGADETSNLTLTANVTFDLLSGDAPRKLMPYIAAGGGYLRQRTLVGGGPGSTSLEPFVATDATVSGGAGVRIALGDRVFIAPEFRMGFEPTTRITVSFGFRPR